MHSRSDTLYTGPKGAQYFEQRGSSRTDTVQKSRARLFEDFSSHTDVVLDFGCGTGSILSCLPAVKRIGVEINETAAKQASAHLDLVVGSLADIPSSTIDKIISYHALEHVDSPSTVLREMLRVLKPSGEIRVFVPCEMPIIAPQHRSWSNNPHMHLHSWTPLTLGNLFTVLGFEVTAARMLSGSEGGRLGALFPKDSALRKAAAFLKACRTGRFHTAVTARAPADLQHDS
ncbi:MAG: class I SAM-dependent methyltransferase [Mesorhizobium sp.]|jgi:SAM-dependent methyltransferase|uniref:class I SAM-dependent methyltransferase n=1 Tax=Mesorhizobium sp. TaxID=1871066 RepID=UPI001212D2BB|nr:class I SAM-dependent methyltransferase [Mesorhizobium sp.]TIM03920.1 MAG: class I SAM-dependent methyltransferase [Mesorhizobium sp.]TIM51042.1 MAG: class I SAM-dependent methyltransferase [Mesorhizobium sp.]TIN33940.1 MAG: class I SAM-dependent methyltransferase [Mesorhizobium sp.]